MVGQRQLMKFIQQQIDSDMLSHFSIIVGEKGSGRKTLAHNIFAMMGGGAFVVVGTSIDAIRNMIAEAHRLNGLNVLYLIPDADTMSVQAKNALLKVTEEPPKGAYFVMTLEDESNTLDTIRSRGTVYRMERYTTSEIAQYAKDVYDETTEIYADLCETPGEVDALYSISIEDFYEYVRLSVDNIQRVSLANALKMSNRIALKAEDEEKYDLKLFWKAFMRICAKRMLKESEYVEWIRITSKSLKRLNVRGINKQMLFDNWIFEIREWR